jgi:apolipoprotein D and lipocalin family protein
MRFLIPVLFSIFLTACVTIPSGIEPVKSFDANRYLGTWYEIARLNHSFEKGLSHVSAEYSLRDDGGIQVKNLGFSVKEDRWKEAIGKAYFVGDRDVGHLKVAFQWPFYGSYVVFKLDERYQHAYVTGNDRTTLWLLARTPQVDEMVIDDFKKEARANGFAVEEIIWVQQEAFH